MKRIISIAVFCFMICSEGNIICYAEGEKPQLQSESYVLMEASTGTVLHEKDMHKVLPPASITKIMTLLLIYEALEDGTITKDTVVTTTDHAASMGGSQVYLEAGEQQSVETLIKCISIASANDACVAMAEHLAGTEEAFVSEMNKKAKALGMNNTNFVNCCGLDVDGHVSTAYDIALMSKELMSKYPDVMQYTTTRIDSFNHVTNKGTSEFGLTNTNKLLSSYEGITGLKTGSTGKARYCLSATATRNDINMIAVVLSAPDTKTRFREAATLLNYGFSQCKIYVDDHSDLEQIKVPVEESMEEELALIPKENFRYITVNKAEIENITEESIVFESVTAPVEKGEELGAIIYSINGKEIGRIALVAESEIKEATYLDYLKKILSYF
ncbi:MAG: D-alanyl-D-alanine carboxypeptidase [Lachnospiraceae bacterium]|nr:D-alanyl-D-alanine carboxypeptidase [Lachnospiraceae bacterium]